MNEISNSSGGVNVYLDQEANLLMERAIELSFRAKRQEATLRIKDHLHRFPYGEFVGSRMPFGSKVNHVNIALDTQESALLDVSARCRVVTKREEASIRLKDHLRRFKGIAFVGSAVER